jgi:hypothetical protein
MSETPQEYTQRMLKQSAGKDPVKIQGATAAKLARLIQRASPAKLRKRPAPGKLSRIWRTAKLSPAGACGRF